MHKEDENNIHPNAPAGRDGPGAFRSAGPLGTNPSMDKWFKPNQLGLEPPSTGVGSLLPVYGPRHRQECCSNHKQVINFQHQLTAALNLTDLV